MGQLSKEVVTFRESGVFRCKADRAKVISFGPKVIKGQNMITFG